MGGLPARPRAAGCRERQTGTLRRGRSSVLRRVRRPRGRRRTRRDAPPGTRRRSRAATSSSSGPSAAAARCQVSRSGSPTPARASASARWARVAPRPWRPGRSPSAPAGGVPRRPTPSSTSSPEATAVSRACSSRPRVAAARLRTASSPVSSAAASNKQRLHVGGQLPAAVEEDLLHAAGEVQLGRQRRRPAELGRGELGRQLQQGQRVAAGLGDQSFGDLLGGCVLEVPVEQGAGSVRLEPGQHQLAEGRGPGTASRRRLGPRTP